MFYGVQTLLTLIDDQGLVPQVSIKDSPRFSYRGLMLDVVRNFQSKSEVMKLLDVMAMYKMNRFHFHLSDNEGWRLEIPGLEELTSVSKEVLGNWSKQLYSNSAHLTGRWGFLKDTSYLQTLPTTFYWLLNLSWHRNIQLARVDIK